MVPDDHSTAVPVVAAATVNSATTTDSSSNASAQPPASAATRSHAEDAAAAIVTREQFLTLFSAVFLPMFLAAVDQTLLAAATPTITSHLGGLTDSSWIAAAYLLASASIIPLYGRLGDRYGRSTMLMTAVGIFCAGSVACGLAQSLPQLVVARALQGLGGGGLMTMAQALIGELIAPRERVKFQGYFAIIFTSASITGPVIGGVAITYVSWRWLFLVNLPLCLFALWRLRKLPPPQRNPNQSGRLDFFGIICFAGGISAALYWFISVGHHFALNSSLSVELIVVALGALGLLVWYEPRIAAPLLPINLLKQRDIIYPLLTCGLFASCLYAMVFFLPIYLQLGHNMGAAHSGLLLLPLTAGMVLGAMGSGRIVARTGRPKDILVGGMTLSSVALLSLGLMPPNNVFIILCGFIAGTGFGPVMPTTQVVVQTVAGRAHLGAATALITLCRSLGGAVGAALFGALVFSLIPDIDLHATTGLIVTDAQRPAIIHAFHLAYLATGAVAVLAIFTASRSPAIKL